MTEQVRMTTIAPLLGELQGTLVDARVTLGFPEEYALLYHLGRYDILEGHRDIISDRGKILFLTLHKCIANTLVVREGKRVYRANKDEIEELKVLLDSDPEEANRRFIPAGLHTTIGFLRESEVAPIAPMESYDFAEFFGNLSGNLRFYLKWGADSTHLSARFTHLDIDAGTVCHRAEFWLGRTAAVKQLDAAIAG